MTRTAVDFYSHHKEHYHEKLSAVSKKIKLFAWYRLFSFLLVFVPLIVWGWNGWQTIVPSFILLILFILLVKKNIQFEKQKRAYQVLEKLCNDELLALEHRFSHFENGKDFLNPAHFNSYDLDLFGEGSLFQFLNRTSTQGGRQKLAGWLQNAFLSKDEIEQRQAAVRELSNQPEWRLNFLAKGHLFRESPEMSREIMQWSETELTFKHPDTVKRLLFILPVITVAAGIYSLFGGSYFWLVLLILIQWNLIFFWSKRVTRYFNYFGRKSELLEKYMQMVGTIEEGNFDADFLKDLQKKVTRPQKASHVFRQLKSLVHQFEFRQNIVVNIVLNSLLLWDIRCTYNLWKWHRRNHKKLAVWLDVISETDAVISLASLGYNHPEYNYPEIHEGGFTLQAGHMGHPLIHPAKRVDNDFQVDGWGKAILVTGANMAGKSTFLRTVGVNLILGRTGAPVCAQHLVFTPVKIYTNMRTTDSLLKDESYFFAELKRIKTVLDRLQNGERIFVILDEMLKGTNSIDKLNGSKKLIEKLLELKAVALIATHDLKISEMEDEYPRMIYNKCFEIKLEGDEMIFDYLLKDGATKTMNATFLMKKMGII